MTACDTFHSGLTALKPRARLKTHFSAHACLHLRTVPTFSPRAQSEPGKGHVIKATCGSYQAIKETSLAILPSITLLHPVPCQVRGEPWHPLFQRLPHLIYLLAYLN